MEVAATMGGRVGEHGPATIAAYPEPAIGIYRSGQNRAITGRPETPLMAVQVGHALSMQLTTSPAEIITPKYSVSLTTRRVADWTGLSHRIVSSIT